MSVVGLVFLTAVAVGAPAIWLLNRQLEQQAWAQVQQGHRAAQALYAARQNWTVPQDMSAIWEAEHPQLHILKVR